MSPVKIAFRNVLRNRRRSVMTVSSIALGATAVLLIGALLSYLVLSIQTETVRRTGHVTIFPADYFVYGSGNPSAYGIADYQALIRMVEADPVLKPMIRVITPSQTISGLISNPATSASKTFFGRGVIWSDRTKMLGWNEYGFAAGDEAKGALDDADLNGGVVGVGLARILGLCEPLKIEDCPPPRSAPEPAGEGEAAGLEDLPLEDFSGLVEQDLTAAGREGADNRPRLDLLAGTAGGAPNVVALRVERAERQPAKELDDAFVSMQLSSAQRLLYGRGEPKVTAVIIQLNSTGQMEAAKARVQAVIAAGRLPLEIRDYTELSSLYTQTVAFFGFLFSFIAAIIGMIVLFTVANSLTMSVMERTTEIGTMRALGVQRGQVRGLFLLEGVILGSVGAGAAVVIATLTSVALNNAGLVWQPPTTAASIPFRLYLLGQPSLILGTLACLILVAIFAALIPANRAARMTVVEAIRHV